MDVLQNKQEDEKQRLLRERKRKVMEAQIAALQLELETEGQEAQQVTAQVDLRSKQWEQDRADMAESRSANSGLSVGNGKSVKGRGARR
jgi:hypothetical protein